MSMTRRQFAQALGAGVILLPFLRQPLRAAGNAPVRRIITISSLGIAEKMWTPTSTPGSALKLPPAFTGLQPVLGQIVLAHALGHVVSPTESHSSPQLFTGLSSSTAYRPTTDSIDQFIAKKLGAKTKLPSMVLGVIGKNEGLHMAGGQRIPPIDDPQDAFQAAFGAAAAPVDAPGMTSLPRESILDMVSGQIKAVQKGLGVQGRRRLDQHLTSIRQLENSLGGAAGASCGAVKAPNLGGQDPQDSAATGLVAGAHADIIVAALACDVTRIMGMQFGISNNQFLQYAPTQGVEQHSMVHSPGPEGDAKVLACEAFLCKWYADLVTALQSTPDPLNPGTTLLDNTMILWGRDLGDGPNHLQYAGPYVLSGATGYLKRSPTGALYDYGGSNKNATVGTSHQRLLLNLAEFMGVTDYAGFGDFSKVGAPVPLTDLKT